MLACLIKLLSSAKLNTRYGDFTIYVYSEAENPHKEHAALVSVKNKQQQPVLTRVHSCCLTGDVFFSNRCDCRQQLEYALQTIGAQGGVLIYLDQEGRNIGLGNKIKAYQLQDQGLDTVEANLQLGFAVDDRSFDIGAAILQQLGIDDIVLMTNNPQKITELVRHGITVQRYIMPVSGHPTTKNYLDTKKVKMQHLL
jgi:GTP cyclohydrolase II